VKTLLAIYVSRNDVIVTYCVSILLGVAIVLTAAFVWPGYRSHPGFDNMFVVALIVAVMPPSMLDLLDRRWKRAIDSKIPEFIRDIADSQKTGMAFTKALEHSARLDYGPLTNELKKVVSLMTWGVPYTEALDAFARRVNTSLAYRTVALLNEVGRSGGRLYQILDAIYSHIRELQDIERDRRRQMAPYVSIIYASFGVYLFVVMIIFMTFFSQIKQVAEAGGLFGSTIDPQVYYLWFFHMSVIESIIGGFVAGKMSEGAMSAGLKHVFALLIISIVVFVLIIHPTVA